MVPKHSSKYVGNRIHRCNNTEVNFAQPKFSEGIKCKHHTCEGTCVSGYQFSWLVRI